MKRANILALAAFLEARGKKYFNMSNWYPGADGGRSNTGCGTAACIGGSACVLWPDVNDPASTQIGRLDTNLRRFARKLGITYSKARDLCYPRVWAHGKRMNYKAVTLKNATRTLRRLAETGKIEFRRDERR